jgi:hypothetical protein
MPIRQQDQFVRLTASDIAVLGRYLFKTQWQTALSRRLGVSRQIVVAWAGSKRPISRKYSSRIAIIVGEMHRRRGNRERVIYLAMIRSIESESARAMMLEMLAEEIAVRVEAVAILARNGNGNGARDSEDAR